MSRVIDADKLIEKLATIHAELIAPQYPIIHECHNIIIQHKAWGSEPATLSFTEVFEWLHEMNSYDPNNPNSLYGSCCGDCKSCLTPIC